MKWRIVFVPKVEKGCDKSTAMDFIPSRGTKGEGAFYGSMLGQNCFIFWVGGNLTKGPIDSENNNDETKGDSDVLKGKLSPEFFLLLIEKTTTCLFRKKSLLGGW